MSFRSFCIGLADLVLIILFFVLVCFLVCFGVAFMHHIAQKEQRVLERQQQRDDVEVFRPCTLDFITQKLPAGSRQVRVWGVWIYPLMSSETSEQLYLMETAISVPTWQSFDNQLLLKCRNDNSTTGPVYGADFWIHADEPWLTHETSIDANGDVVVRWSIHWSMEFSAQTFDTDGTRRRDVVRYNLTRLQSDGHALVLRRHSSTYKRSTYAQVDLLSLQTLDQALPARPHCRADNVTMHLLCDIDAQKSAGKGEFHVRLQSSTGRQLGAKWKQRLDRPLIANGLQQVMNTS